MARTARGFTLVEMLIVVTIIGVLAVVAGTAYRRYMDSQRSAEAYSMLGEIRMREEAYRAEHGQYAAWSNGSEATTAAFPVVDGSCAEPCYKDIVAPLATPPTGWPALDGSGKAGLGINPVKSKLQCGYVLNAGNGGESISQPIGSALVGATAPAAPWWYAVAVCDNDGNSAVNATFATASTTTVVSTQNEHQ